MAIRRLSRQEKQQQTRAAILRSAETLFAKKGVEATSLEEIARHAGLTQGAIYSNFSSKAALWWAIAADRSQTVNVDAIFTGERSLSDELESLAVAGARLVRNVDRTDFLLDQEFHLFAQRHAQVRRRVGREVHEGDAEFGRRLERHAERRGESLPMSGAELSLVIRALARGLIFESMFNPDDVTEQLFIDAFALLVGWDGKKPTTAR